MTDSQGIVKRLLHPVSLIALLIVLSVFVLIGASILGIDQNNVVLRMGERQFARGLITYLFAVATMGTAVVLVVAALTGAVQSKDDFDRGKEVLSLLLGVFGTIIGFYFGTEVSGVGSVSALSITPLRLGEETVDVGQSVEVTAFVSGGDSPYEYTLNIGDALIAEDQPVPLDGWIIATITIPAGTAPGTEEIVLVVEDSEGIRQEMEVDIEISAAASVTEPDGDAEAAND